MISALYSSLDDIPVVGGSAGDGMSFEKTWMIRDGAVFRDAALLLLFHTDLPFTTFKCDYFEPTDHKMVVTDADTELRVVRELNAEPAATEYAHHVGLVESSLDSASFASHPVLVGVGGQYYARSIQKVNADGSLSFFCAIDEGLVLTVAKPLDQYESTLATFERLEAELGAVSIYIGFDCVLRRLAAERLQIAHRLSDLYRRRHVIGFNTYGEQYRSMHVNQTFTGIALGYRRADAEPEAPKDMTTEAFDETADLKRQIAKLQKINKALMSRVERSVDSQFNAFSLFETAIALDHQVRRRTQELQQAMRSIEKRPKRAKPQAEERVR